MNKERRKQINKLIDKIRENISELDGIIDDEQDAFDNLSEGLQCTMRAADMEEAIDTMNEALDQLNEAADTLEEVT